MAEAAQLEERGKGMVLPAPAQFETHWVWWVKVLPLAAVMAAAFLWLDQPLAAWVLSEPRIPDLGNAAAQHGDAARELMWLEQFGQGVASVVIIAAVALLDRAGARRALAIGLGCLLAAVCCHLMKDLAGRSRPGVLGPDGIWQFFGPARGFTGGSKYGSFPSAHTTGAFALAAGLSWFYPRGRGLFYGLALVTAGQRVLHGAHYLSDVMAGMVLGIGVMRGTLWMRWGWKMINGFPLRVRRWFLGGETA